MTRLALLCLMLLSACSDDPRFYQQPHVVQDATKECIYVGAELQECYSRSTGERL